MNRIYEELFILRPDITEEEVAPLIDQVRGIITQAGGTVDKEERWGVRKLAYRIEKRNEGFFVLIQFSAPAPTVKELERRLRVNDAVLKFITVRIDEKLKWLDKRRKAREKRAARRPAPVVTPAAPADEAAARPMMPAAPAPAMPAAPAPAAPETEQAAPEQTAPELVAAEQTAPEQAVPEQKEGE